jgi:hypothetical protein
MPASLEVWVPAASGLAGVLVGSIVSYFIARAQIRAQVVSTSRVSWINNLRDTIAEFQTLITEVAIAHHTRLPDADFTAKLSRVTLLLSRCHLLINPREEPHQKLVDSMVDLWQATQVILETGAGSLVERQRIVTGVAQQVLKAEWVRAKDGK